MSIKTLLSIASDALCEQPVSRDALDFEKLGPIGAELFALLQQRNGFYAFESALHVFPEAPVESPMTLSLWNSPGLWRCEFGELADDRLFFAEDAFGDQFCLHRGEVCRFDAETGATTPLAATLELWAQRLLAEYNLETGYSLLRDWQSQHGPISSGQRLMPLTPFVLGGGYSLDNLDALDAVEGMRGRGCIARQIRDVPDGTRVQIQIVE